MTGVLCFLSKIFPTILVLRAGYEPATQIEGILNSRLLAYRLMNNRDFEVLCPSHFLIEDSLTTIPETDQPPVKVSSYYQALRRRILSFWHQWSRDYLAQLRTREKWQTASPAITIGDVVILREDNTKPLEWPLTNFFLTRHKTHTCNWCARSGKALLRHFHFREWTIFENSSI